MYFTLSNNSNVLIYPKPAIDCVWNKTFEPAIDCVWNITFEPAIDCVWNKTFGS